MCVFCKIINNEIPSSTVYEDDIVKVFLDLNPCTNGHMLIVPRNHYTDIMDIPNDIMSHITKVERILSDLTREKLGADGITFTQNNGIAQEVKHYHMHAIPRYDNDGWKNIFNKDKLLDIKDVYTKLTK